MKYLKHGLYILLLFLKFAPIGFVYRPIQDDYIQYYAYSRYDDIYNDVIKRIGLLNVRPLAGLADIYVWGRFWECMTAVLVIMTLLYYFSYLLFKAVFERIGMRVGTGFAAVYLFCPIGFEAAYWISASSRIIVSMFFVSLMLAAAANEKYVLFTVSLAVSVGFYEQTAFLGGVMLLWLILLKFKRGYADKRLIIFAMFVYTAAAAYYIMFARTGQFGGRSENISLSVQNVYNTVYAAADAWKSTIGVIAQCDTYVPLAFLIFILAFAFNCDTIKERVNYKAVIGVIFFAAAYGVYILFGARYLPYRCHFAPLVGLGLTADNLLNMCGKSIKRVIVFVLMLLFMRANMYQAAYVGKVNMTDREVCARIIENITEEYEREKVYIYGTKAVYEKPCGAYTRYAPQNVTASDWALTGAVRALGENLKIKGLIPVEGEDTSNEG